ncbi:MAG: hypothetical protein FWE34_00035 [Defluviitaleaceae bacterium]|nr:hypothetical protein [Defluviitaleaceae bacterium]
MNDIKLTVNGNAKYIQIDDVDMHDIERVWENLSANYSGFLVDFCFHNTLAPEKYLLSVGAVMSDNCLEMRLAQKDMVDLPTAGDIAPVTIDNFATFAAYHNAVSPEMFWNSELLLSELHTNPHIWDIFIISRDGGVVGYVIMRSGWEIYRVAADSMDDKISLLSTAAQKGFAKQQEHEILFMVDRDNFTETGAAMHLGFRREGYYISYRARV